MIRKLLLGIGFSLLTSYTFAQVTSCAQTLRLAQSTYEQGRLHEIPIILESCLKSGGFNQQEKVQAYKILTNAYIYLEEPEQADQMMLNLLNTDHYFEVNEAVDPAEFVALYKTFRTTPIYRFGGKLGSIASKPNVANAIEPTEGTSVYKRGFAFTAALSFEIPITPKLTFNPEVNYLINSFTFTNTIPTDGGDFTLTAVQKLNYISLPLAVQYKVMDNSWNPYAVAGVAFDLLIGGTVKSERSRPGFQPIESSTFEIADQRGNINTSALVGAGVKRKIGGGFAVAEIRYRYGLANVNTNATTFDNQNLTFNYHYVDSIFKINALSFTLGYVHNIFNPKKLKSK